MSNQILNLQIFHLMEFQKKTFESFSNHCNILLQLIEFISINKYHKRTMHVTIYWWLLRCKILSIWKKYNLSNRNSQLMASWIFFMLLKWINSINLNVCLFSRFVLNKLFECIWHIDKYALQSSIFSLQNICHIVKQSQKLHSIVEYREKNWFERRKLESCQRIIDVLQF